MKKPKILKGWKIITHGRYSIVEPLGLGGIFYTKNQWVKPKLWCGSLCVFRTRKEAREFRRFRSKICNNTERIVRCKFKPSKDSTIWDMDGSSFLSNLPNGTMLAKSVKTLE